MTQMEMVIFMAFRDVAFVGNMGIVVDSREEKLERSQEEDLCSHQTRRNLLVCSECRTNYDLHAEGPGEMLRTWTTGCASTRWTTTRGQKDRKKGQQSRR